MTFQEFSTKAVPEYIHVREASKNFFVPLSRWVAVREAYFLHGFGVTGNIVSIFRIFLGVAALYLFSLLGRAGLFYPILGVVLMAWQLNLDSVDGALARAQGKSSEIGNALDNLGIDFVRAAFFCLIGVMSNHMLVVILGILAGHLLVTFRQYILFIPDFKFDSFVRNFIYVPVLLVILPLIIICLVFMGNSAAMVCTLVSLFYIALAVLWFVVCLWFHLIKNEPVKSKE